MIVKDFLEQIREMRNDTIILIPDLFGAGIINMRIAGNDIILETEDDEDKTDYLGVKDITGIAEKVAFPFLGRVYADNRIPRNEIMYLYTDAAGDITGLVPKYNMDTSSEIHVRFEAATDDLVDEDTFYTQLIHDGYTLDDIRKADEEYDTSYAEQAEKYLLEHGLA